MHYVKAFSLLNLTEVSLFEIVKSPDRKVLNLVRLKDLLFLIWFLRMLIVLWLLLVLLF